MTFRSARGDTVSQFLFVMENLVLYKFDQKLTFLALHMYKNAQNIDL